MKIVLARGCRLEPPPARAEGFIYMYPTYATAPDPVLSTLARWRTGAGPTDHRPVLQVTNGRSRILIDPSDFPAIARKMTEILDAQQSQGVAA